MNKTVGIIGSDLKLSTLFVEKIILRTKAKLDQEHIKMNIVINNKLNEKNEDEFKKILINLEDSQVDYIVLTINNSHIYKILKNNTNIPIINNEFNINDNLLIDKVIKLAGKEVKQ